MDISVNVTNAGAANVSVSNGSTVSATVGNGGAVNVSLGTISPGNATVVAGTLTINSTQTLSAGSSAYAKNVGTAYAASLDIGIPAGPATLVSVGNTTTLTSGSNATVTGTTSGSNLTLAFGIPRGVTPSFAIGNVVTGAAGSSASVTATTTNSGANVTLDLTIPRGDPGTSGSNGTNGTSITLSDATPANLGTASAGSSSFAARADHSHNLPVIAWANLSGVPSNFATNTTLVSGLSSGYSAANHAHNYVTSLNNLTGSLTLAAGSNVNITANGSTLTLSSTGGIAANDSIDGGDYVGQLVYGITFGTQPQSVNAIVTQSLSISAATVSANAPTQAPVTISGGILSLASNFTTVSGVFTGTYNAVVSADNGATWTRLYGDTYQSNSYQSISVDERPLTAASNGTRTLVASYKVAYSDSPASGSWSKVPALSGVTDFDFSMASGTPRGAYVVAHNGQRFVVVGRSLLYPGASQRASLSAYRAVDGTNWSSSPLSFDYDVVTACLKPCVVVNGTFIVPGTSVSGAAGTPVWFKYVWTSADGVAWQQTRYGTSSVGPTNSDPSAFDLFRDIASSGTVAVGVDGSTTAAYTLNGTTWNTSTMPVACTRISYAAGFFWAFTASASTDVCYSRDGISWTLGTMPASGSWYGIAGGSTGFAVRSGGYATVSLSTTYTSANLTVSATATGGSAVSYQWQSSVDAGTTWTNVANATNTTLSLTGLTTANNGTRYRAAASATGATTVYSQSATLTVN
jgi:hypothetical protein